MTDTLDAPADTMTMRERLAAAACSDMAIGKWQELPEIIRDEWLDSVDAILAELQEPSEGMEKAAIAASTCPQDNVVPALVWQAMVQHIQEGGK